MGGALCALRTVCMLFLTAKCFFVCVFVPLFRKVLLKKKAPVPVFLLTPDAELHLSVNTLHKDDTTAEKHFDLKINISMYVSDSKKKIIWIMYPIQHFAEQFVISLCIIMPQ